MAVIKKTAREKKGRKRNTEKGKLPRTAPTVLPQTKKHFSKKPKNWHSSMITPARILRVEKQLEICHQ